MWEFPSAQAAANSAGELVEGIDRDYSIVIKPISFFVEVRHAYTHFTLTEYAWQCQALEVPASPALHWIPIADIEKYPMGKVDRAIAAKISEFQ